MQLTTFTHGSNRGWSVPEFPALDSPNTLVLVFGAPAYLGDPGPIDDLVRAYPEAKVVGCSTSGEIHDTWIEDDSLSVAVAAFDTTSLSVAGAEVPDAEASYAAGATLAGALAGDDLRAVFVLSDGIHVNGSALVRGMNGVLPDGVVVTGGLAGDGDRFERTWVLNDGTPTPGWVSAVGLSGPDLRVGHGSKGGWDNFGPERRVTRAEGNVLYELDGKPALELYKSYLGEQAAGLPATALLFPLALREDAADSDSFVRTVLAVDDAAQSMTFAGDIPEGYLAQLMMASFDRLVEGAHSAGALSSLRAAHTTPALSIAISCVGRRLVLGERSEEEVEATLDVLPEGTRQVGFYSYGELSPNTSGRCDLHNQTMTLTVLAEAAAGDGHDTQ